MSKTILTGLRANGDFHLGNYLGSILPMVQRQKNLDPDDSLFMFLADLHSFTTPIDHSSLYSNIIQNVRMYIAAGIDPLHPKTLLYRQSYSRHTELTWILNCFTYFGEASRMTEFKDKSERLGHKAVTVGLFDYPVLMAADILLYHAQYIPLGDDQRQHLELTRNVAERFNNKFGPVFTIPETWEKQLAFTDQDVSVRIRSLASPESKMSKSVSDPKGTISLTDAPEDAAKKVMSATTDSVGKIHFDFEKQPGISNLLQISALLEERHVDDVAREWEGRTQYGELKKHVASQVEAFLRTFQAAYNTVSDDYVEEMLQKGEERAHLVASNTLLDVYRAVGIRKSQSNKSGNTHP